MHFSEVADSGKLGASVPALCSHVDRGRELPEPEAWVAAPPLRRPPTPTRRFAPVWCSRRGTRTRCRRAPRRRTRRLCSAGPGALANGEEDAQAEPDHEPKNGSDHGAKNGSVATAEMAGVVASSEPETNNV